MSAKLPVSIPQVATWLLRLAVDPGLSRNLQTDPVAFAAWYALIGSVIAWPAEVQRIQEAERGKRLSLERMMKLLSQVNYVFRGRTTAERARLVLEGYAVHDWVSRHPQELTELAAQAQKVFAVRTNTEISPFGERITELGLTLALTALEQQILSFAFLTAVSDELCGIFEQMAADRWKAAALWTTLFATSAEELAGAMRPSSPLRLSGLLKTAGRRVQLAAVAPFWVDLLANADSLADALLEPLDDRTGPGRPARLLPEDLTLAIRLLQNAREPGVNLLLYGEASLEKRQLLWDIVKGARRAPWRVRRFEDAPDDVLPSLTFVAFQLLKDRKDSPVLVIERPSEVLQTSGPDFLQALFGIEVSPDDCLPFDQNLLATNPVPAIWLASDVSRLPDDTITRFVFHAPLKRAQRAAQEQAIQRRLKKLRIGSQAIAQILALDGISSAQLESGVKASRLIGPQHKAERDSAIVQALRRSQRALSRDLTDGRKESVTQYSLEYLNTTGRFTPQQILQSFRRRPRGSVLLYGPPGTGKTQFVEHLARELDLPLVSKSAAALLSKWLGESEQNIAAAFEEASAEDAILFFDEGDSFLRSRERAEHHWEVTQTNELLQRMERFEGIVLVATNLFRNLDVAALRRFTFKIEFRELDMSQRWRMFLTETQLSQTIASVDERTRESWEQRLLLMRYLTPGDFATVKRQCLVLDTQLTPEEWLDQLEIECELKSGGLRGDSGLEARG